MSEFLDYGPLWLAAGVVAFAIGAAWYARRFGAREEVERAAGDGSLPHVYLGHTTRWGLASGTRCKIVGRKPGNVVAIEDPTGKRWWVPDRQVRKVSDVG